MHEEPRPSNPLEKLRPIVWAQVQAGSSWLRERDLSQQQAFVLTFLVQNPGAIQREIAAASRTTPANVSGVLRGLESRGLISRASVDERSKGVTATERGAALVSGHGDAMLQADLGLLAPLTVQERQQLSDLLNKITVSLPAPDPDA